MENTRRQNRIRMSLDNSVSQILQTSHAAWSNNRYRYRITHTSDQLEIKTIFSSSNKVGKFFTKDKVSSDPTKISFKSDSNLQNIVWLNTFVLFVYGNYENSFGYTISMKPLEIFLIQYFFQIFRPHQIPDNDRFSKSVDAGYILQKWEAWPIPWHHSAKPLHKSFP